MIWILRDCRGILSTPSLPLPNIQWVYWGGTYYFQRGETEAHRSHWSIAVLSFCFLYVTYSISIVEFFFFFFLSYTAQLVRSLVPHPGKEPLPPAVEERSTNYWITREFPFISLVLNTIHTFMTSKFPYIS